MDSYELQARETCGRIFKLLAESNLSQKEFAEMLQVSPQTITDWKKGKSTSFMKSIERIAAFLESSPEYLLTGIEAKKPPIQKEEELNKLAAEIKEHTRMLKTVVDSTYNFYLSLSALAGSDKPIAHDIAFNLEHTASIEADILSLISKFLETATPEEKSDFWSKYDRIGQEYRKRMENPADTPYPTSEEIDSYFEMVEKHAEQLWEKSSAHDAAM